MMDQDNDEDYIDEMNPDDGATSTGSRGNSRRAKKKTSKVRARKAKGNEEPRASLEELTQQFLRLFQYYGKLTYSGIQNMGFDYRRAYDILNVLMQTSDPPLIGKRGTRKAGNLYYYIEPNGSPYVEACKMDRILEDIEQEKLSICLLCRRIVRMQQEMESERKHNRDDDFLFQILTEEEVFLEEMRKKFWGGEGNGDGDDHDDGSGSENEA